jgi:hypothetical protein
MGFKIEESAIACSEVLLTKAQMEDMLVAVTHFMSIPHITNNDDQIRYREIVKILSDELRE